ncbi:MAG: hypothetical protein WAN47_00115 [Nitrosotalea sp.]
MSRLYEIGAVNHPHTSTAFWICYRCNLTLHEKSSVSLHNEITNHSARKIEFSVSKENENCRQSEQ